MSPKPTGRLTYRSSIENVIRKLRKMVFCYQNCSDLFFGRLVLNSLNKSFLYREFTVLCMHFFRSLGPPSLNVSIFYVLKISKNCHFLTPSLSELCLLFGHKINKPKSSEKICTCTKKGGEIQT